MFYFRIDRLFIADNMESPKYLLFGPDKGEVKLISFVTTENGQLPDMSDYISTNDTEQKKNILKKVVKKVIESRILTEIENVKDNHIMTFGDTGYVLFESKKIPQDFNWQFIAYESDADIRTNAEMVESILNDDGFDGFTSDLITVIAGAANPALTASVSIAKFAISVMVKVAKKNKDDLIGILYTSLNRTEHYPHGIRHVKGIRDLTNNMKIDYSIFGFEGKQ